MGLLNAMKEDNNFGYTENCAVKHNTSLDKVLDMFALGGAYRKRTDKEVEELFGDAYRQDKELALKCLFYLRDCRGGQGERRFFRVAYKWLCRNDEPIARLNLKYIPEFGRWDDLIDIGYAMYKANRSIYDDIINIIANQMDVDNESKTPSLLAKWMPSENASSSETKAKAKWIMSEVGVTPKEYRLRLSSIRKKINVLERLMSENRFDEIEFDKIPSIAGMRYKNAFAVKEVTAARYKAFMADKKTKVNASVLNPVDIAQRVFGDGWSTSNLSETDVNMLCKYWDNLKDYYQGREENAIAIIDVSGSMVGTPMEAAVSMGAYIADKAHGPFAHHFITFSMKPELVGFEGVDIVDKLNRCKSANWDMNTNIKAVFDMLLSVAKNNRVKVEDMPTRLYIFSDMEFDRCVTFSNKRVAYGYWDYAETVNSIDEVNSDLEKIKREWAREGYKMPQVVFWNLNARNDRIPAIGEGFSYVSGFSPSMIDTILSGKDGYDLMLEKLLSDRYAAVVA